jgi:hypothetical protein
MEKSEKKKSKYFILIKNKEECTARDLKEYFEDPNKYLQRNSKFIIGDYYLNTIKKHKLNKKQNYTLDKLTYKNKYENSNKNTNELFDKIESKAILNKENKNKSLSIKTKRCISAFNSKRNFNNNDSNNQKPKINYYSKISKFLKSRNSMTPKYTLKTNISSSPLNSIHYEYKTPKEILDIFRKYNQKGNDNRKIKMITSKINEYVNHNHIIQEKSLKIKEEEKKNLNNISKYLAQKCDKKEENLLLNKIENYNIKKQIVNYLYKKQLLSEKLGSNYWICDLRRDKNKHKINYVITGRNNKEPWEQIVDSGDWEIEYINKPGEPLTINNGGEVILKNVKEYPDMKSLRDIKVEGKNLFAQEYNNFLSNIDKKGKVIKFRLYKDPQEKKNKSINELIYKENYTPLSRKKKFNLKKNIY